jgi:hypothetical protein
MKQNHLFIFRANTPFPRVRAHIAKAMALAVLTASLPAHGHSTNTLAASQTFHTDAPSDKMNAQPVAVTDYVDFNEAAQAFNIVANDSDADQDTLTIVEASAQFGAVAFTADGLVAYAANSAQPRADEIHYVLTDGRGGRASGKVIVAVR